MVRAAGILLMTRGDRALFLKRGPGGDHGGEWCFPGGRIEQGETEEQAARRECEEETGLKTAKLSLTPWTRAVSPSSLTPTAGVAQPNVQPVDAVAPPPVDFTTFAARLEEEFEPKGDDEHVGHAWAPMNDPPQPLHPGCSVALERLTMNELGVARAISEGRLTSPQTYENIALFAIRITGTGAAYRKNRDEYVWRDPEIYLNPDFLQRCNGLVVIMEHPKGALLNSKEFSDRKIGTVLLPYVRGDEVWGVAKIYDAAAVKLMSERQLSTSPGVTWRDLSVNVVLKQDDGSTLLIEGDPSLLDHIAVCELGVWDKDGAPTGVLNDDFSTVERTDSQMTEEEKAAAEKARKDAAEKVQKDAELKARNDADAGTKLDTLLTHMDSLGKRFDAMDSRIDAFEKDRDDARKDADKRCDARKDAFTARKDGEDDEAFGKRHDAEEGEEFERLKKEGADEKSAKDKANKARKDAEEEMAAADKKRKDSEEDDKKAKAREDAARTDAASVAEIKTAVSELSKRIPKDLTDADYTALAKAQARADGVYQMFGKHAPRPMRAQTLQEYRLSIANDLKEHSPSWKVANLNVVAVDDAAFEVAEAAIYADAHRAALNPVDLKDGELRAITRTDQQTGRTVTEFVGRRSFIHDMGSPPQYVKHINTQRGRDHQAYA